jgi:hypothetical protein
MRSTGILYLILALNKAIRILGYRLRVSEIEVAYF